MALAELIGDERRDVALVGNPTSLSGNNSWFRSNVSSIQDDGELVLNAAVSLCGAAAKKVRNCNSYL
jgi:hypothetical protein